MYYEETLKKKKIKYSKYNYATFSNGINTDYDEKLLPVKYASSTYNYCYQNGALKTGLGLKDVEFCYDINDRSKTKTIPIPDGVQVLATYTYRKYFENFGIYIDNFVVYGSDNYLYFFVINDYGTAYFKLYEVEFHSAPMLVNYNYNGTDCVIMATKEDGMYIWDLHGRATKIEGAPDVTSMCMHYERMYVTTGGDARTIYFSDDLNPTNWSQSLNEGGFINLMDERGTSKKIVSFNDCLYVFREYGIDKIVAYADQTQFQVIPLYTSSTMIYTDTIRVCGDRIMFLSNDGIYYFTGLTTVKYNLNINSLFTKNYNDKACASYYNGKYYLACNLDFDDGEVVNCESGSYSNNVLIELDIKTGEINILRGYDIINLQTLNTIIESKLIVVMQDGENVKMGELSTDGCVFGVPTKKVWKSPKSSFGYIGQDKLIKEISLSTASNIDIVIRADDLTKTYHVKGSNKVTTLLPNIKAKEIAIDFVCSSGKCNISNPQVMVGYL